MKNSFLLSLFSLSLLLTSCKENSSKIATVFSNEVFDEEAFQTDLKSVFSSGSLDSNNTSKNKMANTLRTLYKQNEYKPLWIASDGNTNMAKKLLKDLQDLAADGMNPNDYFIDSLTTLIKDFPDKQMAVTQIIALDTFITHSYLKASHDLLFGMVRPKTVDSLWFHANDSVWNIEYITATIKEKKYPDLDSFKSKLKVYALFKNSLQHYALLAKDDSLNKLKRTISADNSPDEIIETIISLETPWLTAISDTLTGTPAKIQSYQQFWGIKRTGKVDSTTLSYLKQDPEEVIKLMKVNMERVRWLPQKFEKEFIVVNIPTMNFSMKRNGNEVMKMNVVVGKSSRQTPSLNAMMSNIVINPPWGVPPTIAKNDVLPGVLRSGSSYLRRKGLEAFDHRGRKVDASTITASNYKRYMFRQAPGASNALGNVKFNFPNKWDIYMHDTPHREDFEKFDRARSSGCIRLQHPKDLAKYILSEMENKPFDEEKINSIIATRKTKSENLSHKIPVHIVYLTAWADDSEEHIRFARDFYKRDAKLMAAISK